MSIFEKRLSKVRFAVRPYAELYTQFIPQDDFETIDRERLTPLEPDREFIPHEHEELKWFDDPAPGYSWEKAQEFLHNRYTHAIRSIRLTLPRLLKKAEFRALIQELRDEGCLDWQILLLVSQLAVTYRVDRIMGYPGPWTRARRMAIEAKTKELIFRDEQTDDIKVPDNIFTKENLDFRKELMIATVAQTWEIEIHRATPDFEALTKLLNVRYNNATDDIPHEDFFHYSP